MNLTDLHTFSLVAESGTISGAAQRLNVPKSTVSRRVKRLEDALGQALLKRSPRSVVLTEIGTALYQRSAPSLKELNAAVDAIVDGDREPTGTLRLTTVPGFGQSSLFLDCIRSYGLKFPRTQIDLELTPRLVNLIDENFDVGVRLHTNLLPDSASLMSRRLFKFSRAMYATPAYLKEMGMPQGLQDLRHHRIAAHSIIDVRPIDWHKDGSPCDAVAMPLPSPRWLINDSAGLERFVLTGAGLACLTTIEGEALVEQGKLARVLPQYEQTGATASLVWPSTRHLAPRVRAFIDHAVTCMSAGVSGSGIIG